MNKTILDTKIKDFFSLHFLRPENVSWDLHVSLLFQKYFFKKNNKYQDTLEIGSGNGLNTFLNLSGSLKDTYDFFVNINDKKLFKNNDIYNFYNITKSNDIVKKKVKKKFSLVIDHKKNLLDHSKVLDISEAYLKFDCNKELPKNRKYDFIFTTILYWLNSYEKLIDFAKLLKDENSLLVFTVPNENYLNYCQSYKSKSLFWKMINNRRKETLQFQINQVLFERWLKQNNFNIFAKHKLLSKSTLSIWDIGLRVFYKNFIYLLKKLPIQERLIFKNQWMEQYFSVIKELVEEELHNGPKNGGYCMYILQKK